MATPRWQTERWEDRFDERARRCKGALRISEPDLATGVGSALAWIRNRVFQGFADSPAGQVVKLAKLRAPIRPGLVVSDEAIADCAVRPTEAEWAGFVDACARHRVTLMSQA
ncbi:hypothetical protein [Mycobacterium lacus]|uniref:Uncharacterized protein n=1 Tax=Mycobacterium lacus TaxID=169765 RepID=A0A1X1YRG6_9MYCO|nr:hypothetical protein [Mycobacterium lacus]MCV7122724.1 hypothetical protein [Mycobacterium lacus]ORW13581.1 hypothetical protein AWC15_14150 [Mycobacterium lacus]BBX98261.1 hypothetical protein MLAC_35550 [Mycobacterium lacus]